MASRLEEQEKLKIFAQDFARLCHATLEVIRAEKSEDAVELQDAIMHLGHVYRYLKMQCRCDPPGSGEEFYTGHCQR